MKNKNWLKEQLKHEEVELKYAFDNYEQYEKVLIADDVIDLLNQLEEPEQDKVVVPQFVANEIERYDNMLDMLSGEYFNSSFEEIDDDGLLIWIDENQETFARAWLDGYEIENQPKYLVKVNDQGSWLYLKSMSLYKDVERRTDLNSNLEAWKEKGIKFNNKEQAESIAKLFGGEIEELTK